MGSWLIFHAGNKLLKFILCPEIHLICLTFSNSSCLTAWIPRKIIILYSIVKNAGELIVHRTQICLRIPVLQ